MTEPGVAISIALAGDIVVLDMWTARAPDLSGLRALRVEPRRWWLIDAGERAAAVAEAVGGEGALTPIGGGLLRATLTGAGWRAQLMVGGLFDAESAAFRPGDCAATILHHASVWIEAISDDEAQVYFAASFEQDMRHLWGL